MWGRLIKGKSWQEKRVGGWGKGHVRRMMRAMGREGERYVGGSEGVVSEEIEAVSGDASRGGGRRLTDPTDP